MTRKNRDHVDGQYQKPSRGDCEHDRRSGRRMASDGKDQQTGAGQRPASGYLEQNPRRGQHQEGGGIDKNEVGDDLEGNWEEDEGGNQEDTGSVPPKGGDHSVLDRSGAESIKGLGRAQSRRVRSGKDSRADPS